MIRLSSSFRGCLRVTWGASGFVGLASVFCRRLAADSKLLVANEKKQLQPEQSHLHILRVLYILRVHSALRG